jgi:hypothetical protein
MPSLGRIRVAPRPRSRLISRSSGPREVEDERMFPNPPLPNWKRKNNTSARIDQSKSRHIHIDDPIHQQLGGVLDTREIKLTDWTASRPRETERSLAFTLLSSTDISERLEQGSREGVRGGESERRMSGCLGVGTGPLYTNQSSHTDSGPCPVHGTKGYGFSSKAPPLIGSLHCLQPWPASIALQ